MMKSRLPLVLSALLPWTAHAESASAAAWPSVDTPARQGGGEQDAAVIIGVEDYAFAPDVPGAAANATAWYMHLVEGRGTPPQRVTLLRDRDGTRERMLEALASAAAQVQPGGTLWVVFVGHGAPDPTANDGVLVGVDAQQTASGLFPRSVRQGEVFATIEDGQQARAVIVLDACFSGRDSRGEALVAGLQPLVLVQAPKAAASTVVLAAAREDQFAGPLPGADRPAFSYLLLGAMRGWGDANADGRVTTGEAHAYTQAALAATARDRVQSPTLVGSADVPLSEAAREAAPALAPIVAGLDRRAARAPERASAERSPSTAPKTARLRLEGLDDGAYTLVATAADGERRTCKNGLGGLRSCVIDSIPPGRLHLRVEGDARYEETTTVGDETMLVSVDGATGWYGVATIGSAVAWFTGAGLAMGTGAGAADTSSAELVSGLALTAIGGTGLLVFGILYLLDDDEVKVQRFDTSGR